MEFEKFAINISMKSRKTRNRANINFPMFGESQPDLYLFPDFQQTLSVWDNVHCHEKLRERKEMNMEEVISLNEDKCCCCKLLGHCLFPLCQCPDL